MSTEPMLNLRGQLPGNGPSSTDFSGSGEAFSSVLWYSSLILILPILTFFCTKILLLEVFMGMPSGVFTNVVSAGVSVIVLHVGLGLFIYKAYFEGAPAKTRLGKQE